jgi:transposase-like protein
MPQHFLLSAAARTLSLSAVARMSDEEAAIAFQQIRFSDNGGEVYCPGCGCAAVYKYSSRQIWKCKACQAQFSLASGTIFASHKRPLRDYLLAIAIWCNGAKGVSALQLSRDLDCQYRTAFVLSHKLREAMAGMLPEKVSGKVEVDGAYFGGYVKPKNHIDDRVDRRLAENQTGKRKVVVVMRERKGRTLPFVFPTEAASVPTVKEMVASGSTIYSDEGPHWQNVRPDFKLRIVEHKSAYFWDGVHTNGAEGYFSRLRRSELGQHHHISGKYLREYAIESAWREDFRRLSNGEQFKLIADAALRRPPSERWAGYWQRHLDVGSKAEGAFVV